MLGILMSSDNGGYAMWLSMILCSIGVWIVYRNQKEK